MNNSFLNTVDPDNNYLNNFYESNDRLSQSNYYTVEQMKIYVANNYYNKLILLNCNIRSFNANSENLLCTLKSINFLPPILIMSETWLTTGNVSLSNIDGYTSYHTIREGGRGGGVSVFVRDDILSEQILPLSLCTSTIECLTVKITIAGVTTNIVAIYRPHSDTIENFSNALNVLLQNRTFSCNKTIIAGDFNINLLDETDSNVLFFTSTMYSMHYFPTISKPTRFPSSSIQRGHPALLDHIWTNRIENGTSGIIFTDVVSDHCPTFINFSTPLPSNDKIKITFRDKKSQYLSDFSHKLSEETFSFSDDLSVSERTSLFMNKLNFLYCQSFPLCSKFVSTKRIEKPWLTSGILKSIKTKSEYFKLNKLGLVEDEINKSYKNVLTKLFFKSKKRLFSYPF